MAVPENATKLGTVGIAYKGVYNELVTYKYANAVYYNGSTYIALIDNPAGFPSNDGVNWRYLAQGFLQQAISALTVIDESGILGEVDAEVNAQEFLSKIAELQQGLEDTKANKADILDSLEEIIANTEDGRIMGAKAGAELNSNLEWKYLGSVTGKGDATTNFVSIEGYKEIHLVFYNEAQNSIISGINLTLANVGAEVPVATRRAGHYQNAESYAYVGIALDYGNQKVYMGSYAVYALSKNVTTTTTMYVYGR